MRSVRCWPGREARTLAQLGRHVEGDGDRVLGQPLDVGPQRWKAPWARARPGSRRRSAVDVRARGHQMRLEVVERLQAGGAAPQRLAGGRAEAATAPVSVEPQCGQRDATARAATGPADARGGAAGRCRTRRACAGPSSLIQSVVQAGRAPVAPRRRAIAGSRSAVDVGGDGLHGRAAGVGRGDGDVDVPSSSTLTSRRTPRSSMVSTGTSGSSTAAAAPRAGPSRGQARCRPACGHHVAPGWERCRSASRRAGGRASVWTPGGRRRQVATVGVGPVRVASVSTSSDRAAASVDRRSDGSTATPAASVPCRRRRRSNSSSTYGQTVVEAGLHAAVRSVGAVAEPQHPLRSRGRGGSRPP